MFTTQISTSRLQKLPWVRKDLLYHWPSAEYITEALTGNSGDTPNIDPNQMGQMDDMFSKLFGGMFGGMAPSDENEDEEEDSDEEYDEDEVENNGAESDDILGEKNDIVDEIDNGNIYDEDEVDIEGVHQTHFDGVGGSES